MPAGQFATRNHLVQRGFTASSIRNLLKSGDLVTLARGVYAQDEPLTVAGIMRSLQRMGSDLVVGGETALRLHGVLPGRPAELFMRVCLTGRDRIPEWLSRWHRDVEFERLGTARLFRFGMPDSGTLLDRRRHFVKEFGWLGLTFQVSSVERALFEMLSQVPDRLTFGQARDLMASVHPEASQQTLRRLLDRSASVKVNRLFLWYAGHMGYRCARGLDVASYIGTGKRQFVPGGRYVKAYRMTVPRNFLWPPRATSAAAGPPRSARRSASRAGLPDRARAGQSGVASRGSRNRAVRLGPRPNVLPAEK